MAELDRIWKEAIWDNHDTIPEFAWRDGGKPRKPSEWLVSRSRFELGTFQMHVKCVTATPTCCSVSYMLIVPKVNYFLVTGHDFPLVTVEQRG
jgi:hypothetical protein